MKPHNLTQLRKFLRPGMLLTRSLAPGTMARPSVSREPAPVLRVQGNAFTVRASDGRESWHTYQPAKCYSFREDGFTVNLGEILGAVTYHYPEAQL